MSLDALLGRLMHNGAELVLRGALNFVRMKVTAREGRYDIEPLGSVGVARAAPAAFGFGSYESLVVVEVTAGDSLLAVLSIENLASVNAPSTYAINFEFSEDGSTWVPFRTVNSGPTVGTGDANADLFLGDSGHCATYSGSMGVHEAGFVRAAGNSGVAATIANAVCLQVTSQE